MFMGRNCFMWGFFIICSISCRSSVTSTANIWLIAAAAGAVPPLLQTCGVYDRCTGKGKVIFSLICFPLSGVPSVTHSSPKTFFLWWHQNLITSNSSAIIAPYLAIPPSVRTSSPRFSASFHRQNSVLWRLWLVSVSRCQWIPCWTLWPGSRNYEIILWPALNAARLSLPKLSASSSTIFGAFLL